MDKVNWPAPDTCRRLERLTIPAEGRLNMVLDTDTFNEVDDQFAMCYSLLSPERLNVRAIYAAPFQNDRAATAGEGMEKSHAEILRLLETMPGWGSIPVYKGSTRFMREDGLVDSPAARDLVERAMAQPDAAPLYVVAIGAITNVASALLMQPEIIKKICVVWLGGHAFGWPDTREFNLYQDIPAVNVVLDSGCPLILVPCNGVASHLLATPAELRQFIGGKNAMCDALIRLFSEYAQDHLGWAKEIWDVGPIGMMVNPAFANATLAPCPRVSPDGYWVHDPRRHLISVVYRLRRNAMFRDMYGKFAAMGDA